MTIDLDNDNAFNAYNMAYGETAFRLNDVRVAEMQGLGPFGGLSTSLNSPHIVSISYDSVYKFFRALPERLDPPQSVGRQIVAESLLSAELQRVFSAFLFMRQRVARDDGVFGYTPRQIMALAVKSTESNHFAKKIFDLCLTDGASSRMPLRVVEGLAARFDDFESSLFDMFSRIVDNNQESFGITMRVAYRYLRLPTMSEEEYMRRRREGILLTNELPANMLDNVRTLSWRQLNDRLREYSLVATLDVENEVVLLPTPLMYEESLVTTFGTSTVPFQVGSIDNEQVHLVESERLITGTFTKQFLTPSVQPAFRPDQIYWGARALNYWAAGSPSLTRMYDRNILCGYWLHPRVRNWRRYVEFRNPLEFAPGD